MRGRSGQRLVGKGVLLLSLAALPSPVWGQAFLTQDEALELAFPSPATVERATAFLTEEQLERARVLAGDAVPIGQRVVTYYVGRDGSEALGVAYFDAHRVRTVREVVMIVVTPDEVIERVEVLSFLEPPEYMAPEPWIEQLSGEALTDELAVNRGIINLTGATLTAGALTRASRRVLALHRVIRPLDEVGTSGGS